MSVIGIPSDKIQPEGEYISPSLPLPATGRYWNFRLFKSPKCEFYSIARTYYVDGKYQGRALTPEKVTSYSPEGVAETLARLEEARHAPMLEDREHLDHQSIALASYLFDRSFPALQWDQCEYYAEEYLYLSEDGVPPPILEICREFVGSSNRE
jgi:hypothetical protein